LNQNYPNPFNPETIIGFSLPSASEVKLEVFNIAGQKVATLYDGYCASGYHQVVWKGVNEEGKDLASGVYFYSLKTADFQTMKKLIFMK
jgi:flagellar hook assembly protein FlgD